MRATPLTYEHEPRRVFWVVRDLRLDPRCFRGIEVASRAQLPRCATTDGPSYVPTAQRSVWERILASPARVCMYLMANYPVGKCGGRLPGRPAAVERAVVAAVTPDGAALTRPILHVPRLGRPQRTPFLGVGAPVLWPRMRHGFGRARGRRAARRCLRLEMCMETAVVHAYFARHVPKPTRRGCGSAKLYPPEKALHERRDSNCSHGESARSTSGRG